MAANNATAPSFRQQLIALVALAGVSTAIGYTMKVSLPRGSKHYSYSPVSAVAMTELFKLVASTFIISKLIAESTTERNVECNTAATNFAKENYSKPAFMHNLGLALAYAVVNLVTFGIMATSKPSMFFLLKAASPVVTALMLAVLVKRPISGAQWVAIAMQTAGIFLTQYDPCSHTPAMSSYAYLLVFINIAVSCAAGVWNEHIIKSFNVSVNAQNSMMYSCGVVINIILFFVFPAVFIGGKSETGFFENYDASVLAVIAANGSVGLVITAVYKYADVVVKTFGIAASTMCLFILEFIGAIPDAESKIPRLEQLFGATMVFYASYVYIAPPVSTREQSSEELVPVPVSKDYRVAILTVILVGALLSLGVTTSSCAA